MGTGMGGKHSRPQSTSPQAPEPKQQRACSPAASSEQPPVSHPLPTEAAPKNTPQPSAREVAAARAARQRLGYEQEDQSAESGASKLPSGPEPVAVDLEYPATADLAVLVDSRAEAQAALEQLRSKDWLQACAGLTVIRRLAVHHRQQCQSLLTEVVPLVLLSVRSLRSSLCKTAIMCVGDLFSSLGPTMLPHLDEGGAAKPTSSLLAQLLLKAGSNDKRFVIEEVQRALATMVASLPPAALLPPLLAHAAHRNPRVRGKVAAVSAQCLARFSPAELAGFGVQRVLKPVGMLLIDNTPEARDSARAMLQLLQAAAGATRPAAGTAAETQGDLDDEKENSGDNTRSQGTEQSALLGKHAPAGGPRCDLDTAPPSWEHLCRSCLSPTTATAVLRACS